MFTHNQSRSYLNHLVYVWRVWKQFLRRKRSYSFCLVLLGCGIFCAAYTKIDCAHTVQSSRYELDPCSKGKQCQQCNIFRTMPWKRKNAFSFFCIVALNVTVNNAFVAIYVASHNKIYLDLLVKRSIFLSGFIQIWAFLTDFSKSLQYPVSQIRLVGA